nr:hypothetical protein [Tanacetum cinerariifolium]
MIAFLSKPTESEGFEQIIDFLNANPVKYALMVNPTIYTSCIEQFWDSVKKKSVNGEEQLQVLVDRKKVIITEATIKRDLQQEDVEGVDYEAFNEENVSKNFNDPLHSGEDRIQLKEVMEICTSLHNRVFNLENTKAAQAQEIASLKRRVKKLEKIQKSKTHGLKRLYKVGLSTRVESSDEKSLGEEDASKQRRKIADIDADKEITLVDETIEDQGRFDDQEMFDIGVLHDEKVVVEKAVADKEVSAVKEVNAASITTPVSAATTTTAATTPNISMDEITLAKALIKIKSSRPKAKGIVMQEPSETPTPTPTPIVSSQQPLKVHDKGKGIMVEEPLKMKKKDQISFNKQEAQRLQAEFDEEKRLAREKNKANNANIVFNLENTKAAQAQEIASLKRRVKKLEKIQKSKTHGLKRLYKVGLATRVESSDEESLGEEDASKQGRKIADIDADKEITLVDKTVEDQGRFDDQEMFDIGVLHDEKVVVEKAVTDKERVGDELEQEIAKKQRINDENESAELKRCLEIVPNDGDDVTIDATPLSSNKMLKFFGREDLEFLWRLVKDRFEKVMPVHHMDSFLLHNLKTMFEHHVEDNAWKNQQG